MTATATDTVHTHTHLRKLLREKMMRARNYSMQPAISHINFISLTGFRFQTLYSPMGLIRHPFNISDILVWSLKDSRNFVFILINILKLQIQEIKGNQATTKQRQVVCKSVCV